MKTAFETSDLAQSVIAVPPLAREDGLRLSVESNAKLVRNLHAGGVTTFLYGGNANFYHLSSGDFEATLDMLAEICPSDGWMIPSAGPEYGRLLDQAALLRRRRFPLVMVLPGGFPASPAGIERTIVDFVERLGQGVLLYLKTESIAPSAIARLVVQGAVVAVKYAVPRAVTDDDPYLGEIITLIGRERIVSGFGERPAIAHMRRFGLIGFTAGCVCLAPRLSSMLLASCKAGLWDEAERLRQFFLPLEDLRDGADSISVLHYAVTWSGLADMGEILPPLSQPPDRLRADIARVARALLHAEGSLAANASTNAA